MKGCRTCGRVWAATRAPERCPECRLIPALLTVAEIATLIDVRQRRLWQARPPVAPLFEPRPRAGQRAGPPDDDAEVRRDRAFVARRFEQDEEA